MTLHINSIIYLSYLDLGKKMKRTTQQIFHHNLNWTLLHHLSLFYVHAPVAIAVHPALFASYHSEYHC